MRRIALAVLCLSAIACGSSSSKITTAAFEPVYRAGKTLQGATQSGVTFVKFGELMQAFSTELAIAKDRELNASDQKLLAMYEQAFDGYQFSKKIWAKKIEAGDDSVMLYGDEDDANIAAYQLAVEKSEKYRGLTMRYVPADDSLQLVWGGARGKLDDANEVYLGKKPLPVTEAGNPKKM